MRKGGSKLPFYCIETVMYLDTIFFSRKFHFGDRTISNMYEVLKNKIKNVEAQGIEIKINEDHKIVAVITDYEKIPYYGFCKGNNFC